MEGRQKPLTAMSKHGCWCEPIHMTQQAKLQNEKEVSSKYSSSDSGHFSQNPVKSNYNSKYIYLSKDTDLDNSAKIRTNKSNNHCTDNVVNPETYPFKFMPTGVEGQRYKNSKFFPQHKRQ